MLKKLAIAALTFTGLNAAMPAPPAEAGGHFHGGDARPYVLVRPYYYPPYYYRTFYSPPVASYAYVSGPVAYTTSCGWIKRRAVETQSHHWWARYHRCRGL